ncbi:putative glycolipid-binding domain-containing protein [Gordonia malaquae]|uniref:putative glycolipid-binding domain-containing protein n=1 Tax=Gordonia malaquae TaxID=410332 RepID=UPI0030FED518
MTSPESAAETGAKTMFTWRSPDGGRLEQVRLKSGGGRLRAYGRIICAASADVEAYSASYELVTNDIGVSRRLSVRVLRAGGEGQLELSRDMDGKWMVQTADTTVQSEFGGAEAVDVVGSPFFKMLPINRHKIVGGGSATGVHLVSLKLPTFNIEPAQADYTVADGRLTVVTNGLTSELTVDGQGVVLDYVGNATRIV